jgi:pimeloyl-ACP methyl ester carboxylesterase
MAIEGLQNRDWLLVPGTLCTAEVFGTFLDVLRIPQSRRKPVTLRHPVVEDYASEMASVAKGSVVCGFSLGAIVVAHLADRLAAHRIILFGLNPFPDDSAKAAGRHDLERDVIAFGGAKALETRLADLRGPKPERTRNTILEMADKSAPYIKAQTQLALSRPGAMDALSRTQSFVMVLTGSNDLMAPMAQGQAAAKVLPRGGFRLLPGLGHYAVLEDPNACADAVVEIERTFK